MYKILDMLIVVCLGVIVGLGVIVVMDRQNNPDDRALHDDVMAFCEYWNDGVYSDCKAWTNQTIAANGGAVRLCLALYDNGSIAEFSCVGGVVESG